MKQSSKSASDPSHPDYFCIQIDFRFILISKNPFPLPYANANELNIYIV